MAKLPSLSKPLENILKTLNFYDRLTIEQTVRAMYMKPGNFTTISTRLKELRADRFIDYFTPEDDYVYYLDEKGREYVRGLGLEVSDRKPRSQGGAGSGIFYRHHLGINDFFISLHTYVRDNPIGLKSVLLMFDIDKSDQFPIPVRWPNGAMKQVVPDGFFETDQGTFVVELERGQNKITDEQGFKEKLYNCIGLHEVLENEVVKFIILALEGRKHLDTLWKVTTQVLKDTRREDLQNSFYITDSDIKDPAIFSERVWYKPFASSPISLF